MAVLMRFGHSVGAKILSVPTTDAAMLLRGCGTTGWFIICLVLFAIDYER